MFASRCYRELSMFHSLCSYQPVGYCLYIFCLPFYHNDLKTIVLVQMYMHRRDYGAKVMVLQLCEGIRQLPLIVGIHYSDGANSLGNTRFPLIHDKAVPDKIPDGLTPVRVALLPYETVKSLEQDIIQ